MTEEVSPTNSRSGAIRDALSNGQIVRAEGSFALSTITAVTWLTVMLVVTFDQLGPAGPGIFLMIRQLASGLSAPCYAALVGRFRRERLLAGSLLVRGLVVALAIPLISYDVPIALLVITAVEGAAQSAPKALHDALLPWLVNNTAQLAAANALTSLIETGGRLLGAGLAAVAILTGGPATALGIAAALTVIGAALMAQIKLVDTRVGATKIAVRAELVGGLGVLRRVMAARVIVLLMALTAALTGIAQALAPSIATDTLRASQDFTPVLVGAVGLGGLLGGIASFAFVGRRSMSGPMVVGFAICGPTTIVIAMISSLPATITVLILIGVGIAIQTSSGRTVLQKAVDGRSLDHLVGINALLSVTASGVAAFAVAQVIVAFGITAALVATGVLALAAALYAGVLLPRVERAAPVDQERLDTIAGVGAFRLLPVAAVSQLAARLTAQPCAVGEEIVRQGEPATGMFLIGSGRFDVTVDADYVRELTPGEYFGEIALLYDSTRTATVQCVEAGTVWRLDRADFLRAMTGHTLTNQAIAAIASERLARAGVLGTAADDAV